MKNSTNDAAVLRRPAKRKILIAATALAAPALAGAVFLVGSANASSNPAPRAETHTASAPASKDPGVTVTYPDGSTHAAPDSGWISVGPDGKVHQGTAVPGSENGKPQTFTASAPASKDPGVTITNPDGSTHAAPDSGWISVGPDGKVQSGSSSAPGRSTAK